MPVPYTKGQTTEKKNISFAHCFESATERNSVLVAGTTPLLVPYPATEKTCGKKFVLPSLAQKNYNTCVYDTKGKMTLLRLVTHSWYVLVLVRVRGFTVNEGVTGPKPVRTRFSSKIMRDRSKTGTVGVAN